MLPRRLALSCAFLLGISPVIGAAPEDFYQAHLQPDVKMGMSPEELKGARPAARVMDMSGFDRPAPPKPPGAPMEMAELRRGLDRGSVSVYRFKAGKLGAVVESTKLATKMGLAPIEQTQAAVSKLAGELKANFVLKAQDHIVRTGNLLTAQLWEDKAGGLQLYFVASNQEITLVIFDPKEFAKADFFLGAEMLEKSKASAESIRRQLADRADPPQPLIDLLAKPATEKK